MKINSKKYYLIIRKIGFLTGIKNQQQYRQKEKKEKGKLSLITFNLWMEIFLMPHDKSGN